MKSAMIVDGVVTNVIVGTLPGYAPCDDSVQIGWLSDGEVYSAPTRAPYEEMLPNLYPDQFWFGLRAAGYEDDVRDWVAGLKDADPVTWAWASSKLEFATFFERDHPLVEAFREAAGITETELDALWSFAAQ
jgi:hypothetical protein